MDNLKTRLFFLVLIILIIFGGVWVRLTYAHLSPYNMNCDTSTVGIMAIHILQGKIPLFFYGQEYLGPFEPIVIALFFSIFGVSNFTMFYAMIFLSVLFLISTYFLAKEFGGRWAGLMAMAFCAIGPFYLIRDNVFPVGYHVEVLFLGNILFILVLRLVKQHKLYYYILIGLVSGFAFWTQYIILYYLVPIAVFLLINKKWKDLFKYSPLTLICFFLGGLPFWIYTVTHNFGTFGFPPSERQKFLSTIMDAFPATFATLFSLQTPFFSKAHYLDTIILLIYSAAFIYFVYKTPKSHKNLLLILFFISIIAFFGIYNYHALKGCAYYIIPMYSLVPVVFGYTIIRLKGRYSFLGIGIVVFVLAFNGVNAFEGIQADKMGLGFGDKYFPEYINFLKENSINRIICGKAEDYVIQFLTEEEIVITGCGGSEYLPYDFVVERADKVSVSSFGVSSIKAVCKGYKQDYGIYYDIVPYGYREREISPDNWCVYTNYSEDVAFWAFDRDYDRWWSSRAPRKTGMYFTIDLGEVYTISKFQVLNHNHLYNYPLSCRIEASMDGKDWKEVKYIRYVEPLFWSGPRLYWHLVYGRWEVMFDSVRARYLRLIQEGDGAPHPWEINEIFVYEFLGEEDIEAEDYVKDAESLYQFIKEKKIGFVYADFWLSAKIRWFSKDTIGTLRPFNGNSAGFPVEKNISREVVLKPDTAFVVGKENQVGFEKIIEEFHFPLAKKEFNNFICYYFDKWDGRYLEVLKDHSWLYWIGIGMVIYNLEDYSDLLFSYASALEDRGEYIQAMEYYKKSLKYRFNNYMSYLHLVGLYKKLGLNTEYQKQGSIFRHRFIPMIEKQVLFKNNIEFFGFSINGNKFKPGDFIKIDYFWKTYNKELPSGLAVFVHFVKDDHILFQNDHMFLSRYQRPWRVLKNEVLKESFRVDIPVDLNPGEYRIYIGLYESQTGFRIPLKLNPGKNRIMIGKIKII